MMKSQGVTGGVLGWFAAALIASSVLGGSPAAFAQAPVKVGELNSYSRFAAFAVPYRNGLQLAESEINAKGGVLGGRKLELVIRDDGATPGDAVRVAEELVTREGVSFLVGTFLSNIGLAVSDFANQKKTLFLASEPLSDAHHHGIRATRTPSAFDPAPTCRRRCWSMRPKRRA